MDDIHSVFDRDAAAIAGGHGKTESGFEINSSNRGLGEHLLQNILVIDSVG